MSGEAQRASEQLRKVGEPVIIEFPGTPGFDPITGEPIQEIAGEDITAFGYPAGYVQSDIDGTVIIAGDIRLTLELISPRPRVGCLAQVDGVTYRIMNVRVVRKAEEDVVYVCQLRAS
jgi:hypothetical protein